jgi:hypothetical protein
MLMGYIKEYVMRCAVLFVIALILSPKWDVGAEYRIQVDTTWAMPRAMVRLEEDGSVGLLKIRKDINATLDAALFNGEAKAWSKPGMAENIMDGRLDTWWSPDPNDPVNTWKIQLDLGRTVVAKRVRLVFVDTLGLKPFERFSVYVSNGTSPQVRDVPLYSLLGKAVQPNQERVVEYNVISGDIVDFEDFNLVRFVRVVVDVPNLIGRPALAELEVDAIGDNIILGTERNGGSITAYYSPHLIPNIYDGIASTPWTCATYADIVYDRGSSTPTSAFELDLGATFWVDQIFLDFGRYGIYAQQVIRGSSGTPYGYILMTSDGSPRPGGAVDWPPGGKYAYQLVADVENREAPYRLHFNHESELRKVRHIFFRIAHGYVASGYATANLYEMLVFGHGYPAEAVLTSQPVDLVKLVGGGKEKLVSGLRWEAEQPLFPMTRVEARTRSGDTVDTLKVYYKKIGSRLIEVTKEEYYNLKKFLRGPTEPKGFTPGEGWSRWSQAYPQSGPFLSPSLRKFVQFQVKLITEQPDMAPVFGGLYVKLTDPLVRKVTGAVMPREVREVDQPLRYTYRIWSEAGSGDLGFDQVLIRAPVVRGLVSLEISGREEQPDFEVFGADSLLIGLPKLVKEDSVTVRFSAKLARNGVTFDAFVGRSTMSGIWQGVDPSAPGATLIFLPTLPESNDLIGNLRLSQVFTPNGDGINDRAEIVFSLLKVERKEPEVAIYDLTGCLVQELQKEKEWQYVWDGRDGAGKLVPPGVYLCRIRAGSDAGEYTVSRTVGVVY